METTTTTGTGTLTLAGAVSGWQTFAVVGNSNTCSYALWAVDGNGVPSGAWEAGVGTYTSAGTTLSRDKVLASSNAGALVNLAAGTKRVALVAPASILDPNLNVCEQRLSLVAGTAVPTTDQTAKTTVFCGAFRGNRVRLWNGNSWVTFQLNSEISVAVPATLFRLFDVFLYDNAGTLTLETINWNQTSAALTNATAAKPSVITSTAHGLANGDLVGIAGIVGTVGTNGPNGLNGKIWQVAGVAANTFQCEGSDTQGLTYTSGGTWYKIPNTRATALTTQNGVQVKSGDATRRYLGTGMTTGVSGQTEDSNAKRFLWNYYNRILRKLNKSESTDNWTYSVTQVFRAANNDTRNRVEVVAGLQEVLVCLTVSGISAGSAAGNYGVAGIGKNQWLDNNADETQNVGGLADVISPAASYLRDVAALGYTSYNYVEWVSITAGSVTWYSFNNSFGGLARQSGLVGELWG